MSGCGTPQGRFVQEVQMDKIAEQLGLDPAENGPAAEVRPEVGR
jgi:CO/xanthine dehydrogenase Mo-binding subunit